MRTTLTLDPDVKRLIDEEVHRQRRPFKHVVNDAIRRALGGAGGRQKRPAFRVKPWPGILRPGIDPAGFNRLADELEDEAIRAKVPPNDTDFGRFPGLRWKNPLA